MRSEGITNKVWLIIGILMTGFLFSVVVSYIHGYNTIKHIHRISDELFHDVQNSQMALIAFEDQVKHYQEVFMLGEIELLDLVPDTVQMVKDSITNIKSRKNLDIQMRVALDETMHLHSAYSRQANRIFSALGNGEVLEEGSEQYMAYENSVLELGKNSQELKERLSGHAKIFKDGFDNELIRIAQVTRLQGYFNLGLFALVVAISLLVIYYIVNRSISKPIQETIDQVESVTEDLRVERAERERKAMAETLKSMERVIGIIGHELRTPLAAVRMSSEYLLKLDNLDKVSFESFMTPIHDEVIRMSELVNNMLEAARLNSGSVKWNWTSFQIEGICQSAIKVVQPLVDQESVEVNCFIEPDITEMNGDQEAIQRMIINLLSNSVKHTSEGQIDLSVSMSDKDDHIEIEIKDTGNGIPQHVKEKLGKAFVLNSGVVGSDYIKGTGLGLSICKAIIAAHGGEMKVDSIEGHGSTFAVYLPIDLDGPVSGNDKLEVEYV